MAKILYKFPTRERPEKALRTIENIFSLAENEDFIILLTLDLDDLTTANRYFHDKVTSYGKKVMPVYGFSKGKVDAVNKDVWMVDNWDILVVVSDDFEFIQPHFDSHIINDMKLYFPNGRGFLHYPDGSPAKDALCTMSIMDRKYFDIFGYIYNPEYVSVYCDNEATSVAKILKMHQYIDLQLASHNHPAWGKCEVDNLYLRNEDKTLYAIDNETYQRRLKNNFYLS